MTFLLDRIRLAGIDDVAAAILAAVEAVREAEGLS
jgi:hypothetical protein